MIHTECPFSDNWRSIIISRLCLFGLAAYTAERRIKEIGIRKVLGVSAQGITLLLSKEFLQLGFISCIVAFALAWCKAGCRITNTGLK